MAEYFSIEPVENILYKDKGSKFIGYAYPVKDEAAIKEKLECIRQEHPKATHHCYAYRLGLDKNNYRTNDDVISNPKTTVCTNINRQTENGKKANASQN